MKITTDKGRTFDVNVITPAMRKNQILIEVADGRPLFEIAKDFDGIASFTKESGNGITETYDGYSEVVSVLRDKDREAVRLTLERVVGS